MISRVAECCFWLLRYIERLESTARLLEVNRDVVLDTSVFDAERWKPVVVVIGEQQRFEDLLGTNAYSNDDTCEHYLTWDERNPVSIRSSLHWARENARMTREVISREMWELLNRAWQWLAGAGKRQYRTDRASFYQYLRSICQEFQGLSYNTLSHGEAFDFMRLGNLLERINQTARVMDVKYHWFSPRDSDQPETPLEAAQWVALLRLCSAMEPFFKQHRVTPNGARVASFLLQDELFPRAVLHCYVRVNEYLARIESFTQSDLLARRDAPSEARQLVATMTKHLRTTGVEAILERGLHEELTDVIQNTVDIGNCLQREFFDPPVVARSARAAAQ